MGNVDADPAAVEALGYLDGGAAAAEGIEDDIAFIGAGFDNAFEEGFGFLGGVAEAFLVLGVDGGDVCDDVLNVAASAQEPLEPRKPLSPPRGQRRQPSASSNSLFLGGAHQLGCFYADESLNGLAVHLPCEAFAVTSKPRQTAPESPCRTPGAVRLSSAHDRPDASMFFYLAEYFLSVCDQNFVPSRGPFAIKQQSVVYVPPALCR